MPKTSRRTAEERIAALQDEIERIQKKSAEQKAKKDPALRHISGAVRALDKAAAGTKDKATREAVAEARATLTACLALHGASPNGRATRRAAARGPAPEPEKVVATLKKHPGSRSEELCAELGCDAASLRPVLHGLRDAGKVKVQGKARATRYSVVA